MRNRRLRLLGTALLVGAPLALAPVAIPAATAAPAASTAQAAPATGAPAAPCGIRTRAGGEIAKRALAAGTNVRRCGLVGKLVVAPGGVVAMEIPRPGQYHEISVYRTGGGADTLGVGVQPDGTLVYGGTQLSDALGRTLQRAPSACNDRAFNLLKQPRTRARAFRVNRSTIPRRRMSRRGTVHSMVRAMRTWPRQHNNCGFGDPVRRKIRFRGNGESTNSVAMRRTGSGPVAVCRNRGTNGKSILGFGKLPATSSYTVFAATCRASRYVKGRFRTVSGDIKFNRSIRWTNHGGRRSCRRKVDVQSIGAHEAGHWWGLGHVSRTRHRNLTMMQGSYGAVVCNTKLRTLGKGDLRGMRRIYR